LSSGTGSGVDRKLRGSCPDLDPKIVLLFFLARLRPQSKLEMRGRSTLSAFSGIYTVSKVRLEKISTVVVQLVRCGKLDVSLW
jgi:hypothetical protein